MSDCILWEGRTNADGYGLITRTLAHRAAWEEAHGTIPDGNVIHHDCGEKRCVNVEHLRCLTHREHNRLHNNGSAWHERQRAKTHCSKGHEYTPENTARDKLGKRYCRECARLYSAEYYQRNRERLLPQMRERTRRWNERRKAEA